MGNITLRHSMLLMMNTYLYRSMCELLEYAKGFAFGTLHTKITLLYAIIRRIISCTRTVFLAVSKYTWINIYS